MPTSVPRFVTFWTFPEYVVFWPIILLGVALPELQRGNPEVFNEHTAALIWAGTLVFVCIACGMDFNRSAAVIILLALVSGFFGAMWYGSEHETSAFAPLVKWINSRDLVISRDLQRLVSWGLLVGYAWMFLEVLLLSRRFEATFGQIERKRFLRGPQYYKNTLEKPARVLITDVLDWALSFGGRRVFAVNSQTGKEECLGIAVACGSNLEEQLDMHAQARATHEIK